MDVGQADAILIKTPSGNTALIDAGKDKKVLRELGKFLPFYSRTINLSLVSHFHQDHFLGFFEVLERYKNNLILGLGSADFKLKQEWLGLLKKKKIPEFAASRGTRIHLDKDLYLDILSPFKNTESKEPMVIGRLVYQNVSFLFTGDAVSEEEHRLLAAKTRVQTDILKVSHHGSRYSTSSFWLSAVNPKLAIISVGKNSYGHPHRDTLERLGEKQIPVLQTLKESGIILKSDGKKIWRSLKTSI